jgi:hypothetical protein
LTEETLQSLTLALEAGSDAETAAATRKQIRPLRGIRGVPQRAIAQAVDAVWKDAPPRLPEAGPLLSRLFSAAYEDGMAAIALLAAVVPDHPDEADALARDWLSRTDDLLTADALGWSVIGPAALVSGEGAAALCERPADVPAMTRRAMTAAALAFLPIPFEGPSAAALRARLGTPDVMYVPGVQSPAIAAIASTYVRDLDPSVQKGMRRLLRSWGQLAPDALRAWALSVPGGMPRLLTDEVERVLGPGWRR